MKYQTLHSKINQIKKKKTNQVSFFQIQKTLQKRKSQIARIRQDIPYFSIIQSDYEVLELCRHYERTFILFKKLNQKIKSSFFINLPFHVSLYCKQLLQMQTLKTTSIQQLLNQPLIQKIFSSYILLQYKHKYLTHLTTFSNYLQTTPQSKTNKIFFFNKLKMLLHTKKSSANIPAPVQTKKVILTINSPRYQRRLFFFRCYPQIRDRIIKALYQKTFQQSVFSYFYHFPQRTLSLTSQQRYKALLNSLIKHYKKFLQDSLKSNQNPRLISRLQTIQKQILNQTPSLNKKMLSTKLAIIEQQKTQNVSPLLFHPSTTTSFNFKLLKNKTLTLPKLTFLSLSEWVLGRLSNYSLLKKQLPLAYKLQYTKPQFFNSIQELDLRLIHVETKNIFEFFFFTKTQELTEPMVESILKILITFWKLSPFTIAEMVKYTKIQKTLHAFYTLKNDETEK